MWQKHSVLVTKEGIRRIVTSKDGAEKQSDLGAAVVIEIDGKETKQYKNYRIGENAFTFSRKNIQELLTKT